MDLPAGLDAPEDPAEIRVLTLNCWGLKFISTLREERLAEIGNRLAELATPSSSSASPPLSIVALQECWCRSDFAVIHARTRHVLPHARFFANGVWGAGLAVLSRWPLAAADVCGYSLNGRPTAFWRGDWYVGKGIARAVVRVSPRLSVEVFVTHTHPGYEAGRPDDSYLAHQLAQMWEMGARAAEAASGDSDKLVLVMGDFNVLPQSLPYRVLQLGAQSTSMRPLTVPLLRDVWRELHPASSLGPAYHPAEQARQAFLCPSGPAGPPSAAFNLSENGATSNNVLNTWRWSKADQKTLLRRFRAAAATTGGSGSDGSGDNANTAVMAAVASDFAVAPDTPDPRGQRLDYIFYAAPAAADWSVQTARVAMVEPHPTLGCSVSDHFAVEATLARRVGSPASSSSASSISPGTPGTPGSPATLISPEDADVLLCDQVLAEVDRYTVREHRQRYWRGVHFFATLPLVVACHVAIWFIPSSLHFVAFLLMLFSCLALVAGTIDGLLALLFFSSEIRCLEEFRWKIANAKEILTDSYNSPRYSDSKVADVNS